jgi:translation initiation factor IF-1
MGKNINGGNKNKKFARKQVNGNNSNKLRLSMDEYEKYAIVIRISGGSICRIKINGSDNEIICHIRGKYRGRNKNSNLISSGTIILVGLRPDMSSNDECDLLYVYEPNEIEQLLNLPHLNISSLLNNDDYKISKPNDGFIFSNEEIDCGKIVNNEITENNTEILNDDIINFDDI